VAQTRRLVVPDSIVMVRDPRDTLVIGYVFPRVIAIEYLNLRTKLLPSKDELIASLQQSIATRDAAMAARDTVIRNRDQQTELLRTAVAKSDSIGAERERQLRAAFRTNSRLKRIMKLTLPVSAAAGLLLGLRLN